jgi:enolase
VIVTKQGDKGGRNEYAAAKAIEIIQKNQVCISFASDGIDNKSESAGAIIDSLVLEKANREGIDISMYIREGSYDDLCKDLGVQIITGPTGSNVSDCILLLQGEEEVTPEVVVSDVFAESIADSRNIPTLRVTVIGSDGSKGMFSVPSGASTGIHEAHELRDDGTSHGGVTKACELINTEIVNAIQGISLFAQKEVDMVMRNLDGTETKSRLGGNSLIGVSIALAKAAASSKKVPVWKYLHDVYFSDRQLEFPRLYANLINGGKHASTALAFQEYHVVPKTKIPSEALQIIQTIQEALKSHAEHRFGVLSVGDEGGYALPYTDVIAPLTLLKEVVEELGLQEQVDFALDVASSSFYDVDAQVYRIDNVPYSSETLTKLYETIAGRFPMVSVEDPFNEDAFDDFAQLKRSVTFLRVGDDLTTTNKSRLEQAIRLDSVDALIIKPNQIGTLTETIETMLCAFNNGIKTIVSHRSGETMDDFIADLAYASGSFGIKAGARGPKEREAKYTRLLAINEEIK